MNKKENDIAKNPSSGAEKVENIGERARAKADTAAETSGSKEPAAKSAAKTSSGKKTGAGTRRTSASKGSASRASAEQKEKAAAKKRIDVALAREERKAKKAEMKAAQKAEKAARKEERKAKRSEKRLEMKARRLEMKAKHRERAALAKEKRAERKAERMARKELLRNETAAQRVERIEKERADKLALKKQKREQAYNLKLEKRDARLKKREQKLKDKQHRRETRRTPGFRGWLAAVISLGVVTLALTAVVTLGAIDMRQTGGIMTGEYRGTIYELVGIMENVDADLGKIRVSASPSQQSRLLTDLLVQARLAESSLERFPIDGQADANVTAFINRTASTSETLLDKIRTGGDLTESDAEKLEKLYETNRKIKEELSRLAVETTEKDMMEFMKAKKDNRIGEIFNRLENATLEENRGDVPFQEAAAEQSETGDQTQSEEISSSRAEELCRGYFKDYAIAETEYAGETVSRNLQAYNFVLRDEKGRRLFAQIAKKGGALISFDFYEDCSEKNFDLERAKSIADDYLSSQGYENMTAVWVDESGVTASFLYVCEADGTAYYPDSVKVKVCESRGMVVGLDATAYLKNHRSRSAANAGLSLGEAQEKLNKNLQVESSRLSVIPVGDQEIAAYEFLCTYGDETYFVYLDANTGEELRILNVLATMQGRSLR